MSNPLEAMWNWFHTTYNDEESFFTAVSHVMTDPTRYGDSWENLSTIVSSAWHLSWDLSPAGFILSIFTALNGDGPDQFNRQWPGMNSGLVEGGYYSMGILIIPNVYRVSIEALAGGRQVVNVIHVEGSSTGQEAAAGAAVKTAWEIASGPLVRLNSQVTMQQYVSMDLSSATGGIATVTSSTAGGVAATQFSTRAASALVKWNGASRSRSTRGRLYYGPLSEVDINTDGATVASASSALFTTAFTNFRNSLNSSGFPLVVASRKLATAFPVTSFSIESTIATQRRRIRS